MNCICGHDARQHYRGGSKIEARYCMAPKCECIEFGEPLTLEQAASILAERLYESIKSKPLEERLKILGRINAAMEESEKLERNDG